MDAQSCRASLCNALGEAKVCEELFLACAMSKEETCGECAEDREDKEEEVVVLFEVVHLVWDQRRHFFWI